jgi:hypothetical protein
MWRQRSHGSTGLPRAAALAVIPLLILSYLPLTGLDHLHLHISPKIEFIHAHLHIGHHNHSDPADGEPDGADPDSGDPPHASAVVSYGHAHQICPDALQLPASPSPSRPRLISAPARPDAKTPAHPSWDSRAPPV